MTEGGLLAVKAVGEIVVEPVVSEALVDRQADVVEAGDLHDDLAPVVVEGVEGGVAHDLVELDDRLVGYVAAGDVITKECHLLVGTRLATFKVQRDLFDILLEDVVVEDSPHCSGRSGTEIF